MARGSGTQWWQSFGNLSQMISALAALGALIFIAWQVSNLEASSRKANARQVYLAYSNAGLTYPELLRPADYGAIRRDPNQFERYKWYVTMMIFAYDEMIAAAHDEGWAASFQYELPDHFALLCDLKQSEPRFFTQFEADTNALIDKAMQGKCPA